MKLYYIILLFTYFKFHMSFYNLSYYNYIKLCNLEIWISRAPLTYTNSRTVIQTTKKCTTLTLQCVYSHTYLMLSTFTLATVTGLLAAELMLQQNYIALVDLLVRGL